MEREMKDVLNQLAEINSASEKIMKNTNHEKIAYAEHIKKKTAEFDAEIQKQISQEVEELRVKIISENATILEENHKELDITLKKLDETYQANKDKWIQTIFEDIIKE